jgi:peptidoglycan/xylan/chitin deacetylase (PgdA/CDA1 family)
MEELIKIHSDYGLTYDGNGSIEYAYAAVSDASPTDELQPDTVQTEEGTKESNLNPEQINNTEDLDNSSKETASPDTDENSASNSKNEQPVDGIYAGKTVYLTFDDGPSMYTDEILDILDEYNIKATFFVIGKTDDTSKEIYKRIVNEGHTLGMHSYSHKYEKIYNSVKDFDKDFTKLWKLLYDTTGYKPSIYRFPGGSDNLVNKNGMEKFISYLNDKSIIYFDWNVVSGDATGVKYTKDQLIDNVLGGVALKKRSIVLMHDSQTKKTTVDSLPGLLDELIAGGAQILPLDKDVSPIQMIKADSVK